MSETLKWNETQAPQLNNIKIDLKNGKIDITADNKLTKSELKSIENILTKDKNEIIEKSKIELILLKKVIIKDLENRVNRWSNTYISSLLKRTENFLGETINNKKDDVGNQTPPPEGQVYPHGKDQPTTENPVVDTTPPTTPTTNTEPTTPTTNTEPTTPTPNTEPTTPTTNTPPTPGTH